MSDWADNAWNDFAAEFLADEPSRSTLLLLKQAWLHGARTAIDEAVSVVRVSAPADITEEKDPTPWCSGCGAMRKSDCHCGPIAANE